MLQFDARVVDAELPVDPGLFAIALLGADCRAASGGSRDLRSSCRRGFRSEVFHQENVRCRGWRCFWRSTPCYCHLIYRCAGIGGGSESVRSGAGPLQHDLMPPRFDRGQYGSGERLRRCCSVPSAARSSVGIPRGRDKMDLSRLQAFLLVFGDERK